MLRFRFFYEFLLANERPTAQEIKDEYLDTVSKVYYSYFRSYLQRLMKLKFSETATKLDMLGNGCKIGWLPSYSFTGGTTVGEVASVLIS